VTPRDLQRFCAVKERQSIAQPWSRGDYTYATNGRILVRLPRHADVPENADAPNVEKIWPNPPATVFFPIAAVELPKATFNECERCEGRGYEHDCPDCRCECEKCRGAGDISSDTHTSLAIGGVHFCLLYVRPWLTLPEISVAVPVPPAGPLEFRFEGGDGLLMPLKGNAPLADYLDIDLLKETP